MYIKKDELEDLILNKKLPYTTIGKMYGISDTTVKKIAVKLGIKTDKRKIDLFERFYKELSDDDVVKIAEGCEYLSDVCNKIFSMAGYKSVKRNGDIAAGDNRSEKVSKISNRLNSLGIHLIKNKRESVLLKNSIKGDVSRRRKTWGSYRNSIRKDAQKIYNESGLPYSCCLCGYDKYTEVCHIKAVKNFSDDTPVSVINDINNLVRLCPNHHWEFDHGIISTEEIIEKRNNNGDDENV